MGTGHEARKALMTNIPANNTRALVKSQLNAAAKQLQDAKDNRVNTIRLARASEFTWDAIGADLGITDAACIRLVQRADGGK